MSADIKGCNGACDFPVATHLYSSEWISTICKGWDFDKVWENNYGYNFEKQWNGSEIWPEQGNLTSSF